MRECVEHTRFFFPKTNVSVSFAVHSTQKLVMTTECMRARSQCVRRHFFGRSIKMKPCNIYHHAVVPILGINEMVS